MNIESAKKSWRPVFAWVFIAFFAGLSVTILGLLWLNKTTLDVASGVIITMLAAGGTVTGVYTYGRTTEKVDGVADYGQIPPYGTEDENQERR